MAGNAGKGRERGSRNKITEAIANSLPKVKTAIPETRVSAGKLTFGQREGETPQQAATRHLVSPQVTGAMVANAFMAALQDETLPLQPFIDACTGSAALVNADDMTEVEAVLVNQATALSVMFNVFSGKAAGGLKSQSFEMCEKYLRMALKAQNQCRMTLETLSNIKNPSVVFAKQFNSSNGPQQVNNAATSPAHAEKKRNRAKQTFGTEQ